MQGALESVPRRGLTNRDMDKAIESMSACSKAKTKFRKGRRGTKQILFPTLIPADVYKSPAPAEPDGVAQSAARKATANFIFSSMPRGGKYELGVYETPSAYELQRLMWVHGGASAHLNEVWPRIYIGDMWAAKDKRTLQSLAITHVLNAADGKFNVCTGASFYRDTNITYHGVEAFDMPSFDMSPFFNSAARFIKDSLNTPHGRVFVHCAMGLSRSSTLVLAYLMIHEHMTLVEAITAISEHRNISPNSGFLEQLRRLDQQLNCQRR